MNRDAILVEHNLITAAYSYPFAAGWLDVQGVELALRPAPGDVEHAQVALVDSIDARAFLRSHTVVRDIAVATSRHSMLTLASHTRPDDVADATVVLSDLSAASRAVAAIVIPEFYGITVSAWTTEPTPVSESMATVTEGVPALIPIDDEDSYQEDLGRAWFLLTDTPLVTHVCLVRRDILASTPERARDAVARLVVARDVARTRGRELRRNLSVDLGIEREVLADSLADQALELGAVEEKGLIELWKRSGRPLGAAERRAAFVSTG